MTALVPPGGVLGILGGGQLGRMLAMAAARLGIECHIYSPDSHSPAFQVTRRSTRAPYEDEKALACFAAEVDAITYEFENIPIAAVHFLSNVKPLAPAASALEITADRLTEKRFVRSLGIETANFQGVDTSADLASAIKTLGCPAVLKTRRYGYDGKGQATIRQETSLDEALASVQGQPAILEAFVPFIKEISIIAARGYDGTIHVYDMVENEHRNHILFRSTVPARVAREIEDQAGMIAFKIASALNYVGVLAVELFVTIEGKVLVNEIAPRVHNSGHWTIEACSTSQFENHVRAVCGWPIGSTRRHCNAVMQNLIGDEANAWALLASHPQSAVHLYGKAQASLGRKMGHVTRVSPIAER